MLVLTRRIGQKIVINGNTFITILKVGKDGKVDLGIDAPSEVEVHREEVYNAIQKSKGELK